jgi:hypothetical protein
MDKQIEGKFGIQECSKCQYKLRCDECVYNKKDIEKIMSETRKETAEKFAERLKAESDDGVIHLTLYEIDEICKELSEGK